MGKPGLSTVSLDPGEVIAIYHLYCIAKLKTWFLPRLAHPGAGLIRLGGVVAIDKDILRRIPLKVRAISAKIIY